MCSRFYKGVLILSCLKNHIKPNPETFLETLGQRSKPRFKHYQKFKVRVTPNTRKRSSFFIERKWTKSEAQETSLEKFHLLVY
ncbi:hypothetical protein CsatB_016505 [Cannabis sativa]